MNVALSAICGFIAGLVILKALLPSLQRAPFLVENFRKVKIPTAAGLVIFLSLITVEAGRSFLSAFTDAAWTAVPGTTMVITLVGAFTAFGLLDDLAALPGDRGFKGHLRALAKGRLTTGSLKLFGGGLVALAVTHDTNVGWVIVDALIIALSANLTNLFDLRPGRTLKVVLVWGAVLFAVSQADPGLASVAVVFGAAMALFVPDLQAKLMLGDTGSNAVGAALGVGVLLVASDTVRIAFLVALIALTAVGDLVGFTKIIKATPPLRYLDELGRPRN
jgi:UDP-N-acetylmuramyl pentapeptide phosphotransferase/UDP-N-acetylglucosamine-1-phosphate transferase